jgi:hypothetical protein
MIDARLEEDHSQHPVSTSAITPSPLSQRPAEVHARLPATHLKPPGQMTSPASEAQATC